MPHWEPGDVDATIPVAWIWIETPFLVTIQIIGTFITIPEECRKFLGERNGSLAYIVFLI
jgi:hypothetical protein